MSLLPSPQTTSHVTSTEGNIADASEEKLLHLSYSRIPDIFLVLYTWCRVYTLGMFVYT